MARRYVRNAGSSPRGSVLLGGGPGGRRGRRGPSFGHGPRRGRYGRRLAAAAALAALAGGAYLWQVQVQARDARQAAAARFAAAWERGDRAAMWRALTPAARARYPQARFAALYDSSDRAAGATSVRAGALGVEQDERVALPVTVTLRDFDDVRGTIELPLSGAGDAAGVDWRPALRLPGLRPGEAVRRRAGRAPRRGRILDAAGRRLDATVVGSELAGAVSPRPTGLQRIYDERLAGRPSAQLVFGRRVVARTRGVRGRSVRTTLEPALMRAAHEALGAKLGGIAVVRPRDGAIQALAGLAVSAPQPPGSTFKIITTAAALEQRLATPSTRYPLATFATLSGVKLANASGERCGGTLTEAFVKSCNSVFAPLGAKLGAKRLVEAARAFGFGETPAVPAAKPSRISAPADLDDALAVGAAAIGQDRDLATPLQMAGVGATIATGGRRARPRIATSDPVVRRRVVSPRTARQVRAMMIDVVRTGTGTAAAVAGVEVAGKTGTAELRPNSKDPKDADAWFVAFAPARKPKVAIAVMLIGAGFGGDTAAPLARRVLAAALSG